MSREDPQLRVRIPAELKETLERRAVGNRRTLTAEIVSRLEETTVQDTMFESSNGFERIAVEFKALYSRCNMLNIESQTRERIRKSERASVRVGLKQEEEEVLSLVKQLYELLNPPAKK
ncbi:Arc family DNA-binding protein [Xenorhabdus bovienii]|uniref:Arc family DNA-binding protein n=1 Tax=Xenorhabdus bovienii TaxID=40576 RepID=UPI0023B34038|nr:Arc family DNA-binding protein [Xenorhabdus bovienii]MDE9454218.1 Arc family DNA-binding protein [Xenorhabdus bovienii]